MRAKIGALLTAAVAAVGAAGAATWAKRRKADDDLDLEVTATVTTPAPAPPVEAASPGTYQAPTADDLTAVKGLGKVKAAKLIEAGVTTYAQIAAWSDDDIAEFGLQVNTSPGQIKREDWVGQARALAEG